MMQWMQGLSSGWCKNSNISSRKGTRLPEHVRRPSEVLKSPRESHSMLRHRLPEVVWPRGIRKGQGQEAFTAGFLFVFVER